jgi:hypothetical protein
MTTPLSEHAQRQNLRNMADKAQRASERAYREPHRTVWTSMQGAYADGVEDVLLYIMGDASPSTWLANILNLGLADMLNADERD